ncbi:MAG: DNA-binding domain-containing protein [Woeseia sp.]
MLTLPDLQRSFTDFLLSAPGTGPDPTLCDAIRKRGIPAEQRLAIYKNNVYTQLVGALRDSYPAVHRLVGDEFFRFAATEYVLTHPPRSPRLLGYGDNFPGFLEGFEPAGPVPYLSDVARLEQLYLESYHAAEATPLAKGAFAKCIFEGAARASLRLHPSARLMTSPFPVSRIWELNVQSSAIRGRTQIPGGAEYLLIVRPRATVEVRRISRGAYAALAAIGQGLAVAEALAAGADVDPGIDLGIHLLSLADGETFCSCEENQ